MSKIYFLITCFLGGLYFSASAQMFSGQDTLYGNEWINFTQTYFKIKVTDDGIYRVNTNVLADAGLPVSNIPGSDWRLYHNGVQVPVFVSTNGLFANGDFIEFWGEKNRSEVDFHLFDRPDEDLVNPWYSMYSDTSTYYLVQEASTSPLRYTTIANNLNNLPSVEPYCWRIFQRNDPNYYIKHEISEDLVFSWFNGDGFATFPSNTTTISVTPPEIYPNGATEARVRVRYGANRNQHQLELLINDLPFALDNFYGWKIIDKTFQIPINLFSPSLTFKIRGLANAVTDRNFFAGCDIRYPATFNFPGAKAQFRIDPSIQDKYLEINNFDNSNGQPILYDLALKTRLQTGFSGNKVVARLLASNSEHNMVLVSNAGVKTVLSLQKVQFRDFGAEMEANYIIISNPKLYQDPLNGNADHVAEFADYRRSAVGGGHTVAVVEIQELYEQFGYGIRSHPIAIRNFTHFIHQKWDNSKYLFLIGKGINHDILRAGNNLAALSDSLFYVPIYGSPGVDQSFVMRRGGLSNPVLLVGRLAVTEPVQIKYYLDKVKDYEAVQQQSSQTLAERAWMKRAIHISGGTPSDAATIKYYSEGMANIIRNNRIGADLNFFYKTSNDPVQSSSFERLKAAVKGGASLWMIFGHSGSSTVDYDIGSPSNYQNGPRYPYLMILGCLTGTCSIPKKSIGEDYVLTQNSGAIAYSASSFYGFTDGLYGYGSKFYELLGGTEYGKTLGEVTQATIHSVETTTNPRLAAVAHQFVLQGDPAIRLHNAPGPDYVVDPQSVKFNPNPVPTDQPSYNLSFDVANIGENIAGSMAVKVEERQPDNSVKTIINDTITAPALRLPLSFTVPNINAQTGYHRYFLQVDPNNSINELPGAAELNNKLISSNGEEGIEVYFYSNDIQAVFPTDYAIISKQKVSLYASTLSSATSAPLRYLFEMDTIETFNSPYKRKNDLIQSGGLLEWKQDLGLPDSTVVYWRVSRDSIVNGAIPWRSRSFIYLEGSKPGWNQSNYGQYKMNTRSNIEANDTLRTLNFTNSANYIRIRGEYRDPGSFPALTNGFEEGLTTDYQMIVAGYTSGVAIMVHNPTTGHVIWNPPGGPYNSSPNKRTSFFYFNLADSLQRIAMMEFIKNDIPEGAAVGILMANKSNNQLGYAPERWGKDSVSYQTNLFQVLEKQGAKYVRNLANYSDVPPVYCFIFRKNDPQFGAIDTIMDTPGQYAEIRQSFAARWFAGQTASERIGPSAKWNSLHFHPEMGDNPSDEVELSLLGVRPNAPDTVLMVLKTATDTSLAAYSTQQFPYLKVRINLLDTVLNSATALSYVRILYDPIPEGALHPTAKYEFMSDTLQRGQPLSARIAFANISNANFDSLTVKYRVENQSGNNKTIIQKLKPLVSGDTLQAYLRLDTKDLMGQQRFGIQPKIRL